MVYSNVVYCPNVAVGWRSGVRRRRLCVRCEGCCCKPQSYAPEDGQEIARNMLS